MEMTARCKITGHKIFIGSVEGKNYDNGTIFVEATLKGENSKGYASQPYRCTSSEVVKKIQHLPCPLTADVVLETVTDGRGEMSQVVQDVKPIQAPQKAAA